MSLGTSAVLSFSLALASTATPVLAEHTPAKSVAVRYGDLDLSKPADVNRLYARIRAASRDVCKAADERGAARRAEWNACRRDALDRAVAELGSEAVARLHAARTQRTSARAS